MSARDASASLHSQVLPNSLDARFIPDTRPLEAAVSAFRYHLSFCGLGSPFSGTRADLCSTIYKQTGHVFDLENFLLSATQTSEAQNLTKNKKPVVSTWPAPGLVQLCINYYVESGLYSVFPFADVSALQVLLDSQVLDHSRPARAASRACLAAFTANITIMHRHKPEFGGADPDTYAQAAFTLIPQIIVEPADLRTLEAVMLLVGPFTLIPLKNILLIFFFFCFASPDHLHFSPWKISTDRPIIRDCHTNAIQPRRP